MWSPKASCAAPTAYSKPNLVCTILVSLISGPTSPLRDEHLPHLRVKWTVRGLDRIDGWHRFSLASCFRWLSIFRRPPKVPVFLSSTCHYWRRQPPNSPSDQIMIADGKSCRYGRLVASTYRCFGASISRPLVATEGWRTANVQKYFMGTNSTAARNLKTSEHPLTGGH